MAQINLKINKNIFNDIYYPYLLEFDKRYEVYYGGSGSGKSVAVDYLTEQGVPRVYFGGMIYKEMEWF